MLGSALLFLLKGCILLVYKRIGVIFGRKQAEIMGFGDFGKIWVLFDIFQVL